MLAGAAGRGALASGVVALEVEPTDAGTGASPVVWGPSILYPSVLYPELTGGHQA